MYKRQVVFIRVSEVNAPATVQNYRLSITVQNNCTGAPDCNGDGASTPCPCGGVGLTGNGCPNSVHEEGGHLGAIGLAQVTNDSLVLDANNTAGISFGDGVRCVDGALIRLGTLTSVGGACSYPTGAQASVSVRGATPIGSGLVGYYQTYYRNAASTFCPPETFNVTNGWQIVW